MTSPRRPLAFAAAVLAGALALAACSSSGTKPAHTDSPGSSHTLSPLSSSSPSTPTQSSGSSAPSSDAQSGGGEQGASGKPIGKQTIQGTHVTYDIAIYGRNFGAASTANVTGSDLKALVADNKGTLTRTVGTTTVSGHRIGVAEAVLHFTGAKAAATRAATQVAILLTNSASNGVITLLANGFRLAAGPTAVPANAARNAVNNGAVVTVVQAWYLTGSTPRNDPRLNETVEDISAA